MGCRSTGPLGPRFYARSTDALLYDDKLDIPWLTRRADITSHEIDIRQIAAIVRSDLRCVRLLQKANHHTCNLADDHCSGEPSSGGQSEAAIDHKVPLSRGGTWRWGNIVLACAQCNSIKGNMRFADWDSFMRKTPNWWNLTVRAKAYAVPRDD